MSMQPLRILLITALMTAVLSPAPAYAALNIITREIRSSHGVSAFVSFATVPTLSIGEVKGDTALALSYRNMPEEAVFTIVRARGNQTASGWNFPADADADGEVNAAIPASLPRGVYALRAIDPISRLVYAQSETFRASGRGKVSLVARGHREATFRAFTGIRKYEQTLGLSRSQARRECRKTERAAREEEEVICVWGERTI